MNSLSQKFYLLPWLALLALSQLSSRADGENGQPINSHTGTPLIELVNHSKDADRKGDNAPTSDPLAALNEMRDAVADLKRKVEQLCTEREHLKRRIAEGDKAAAELEKQLAKMKAQPKTDPGEKKRLIAENEKLGKSLKEAREKAKASEKEANEHRAAALRKEIARQKLELQIKQSSEAERKAAEALKNAAAEKKAAEAKLLDIAPIYFGKNRAESESQESSLLAQVKEIHKMFPRARFAISGYTCTDGSPAGNLLLSQCRAKRIANLFKHNGIPAAAISGVVGKGEADPIGDNATQSGREANRRVEIKILRE